MGRGKVVIGGKGWFGYIRDLGSLPTLLHFSSITTGDKVPARLIGVFQKQAEVHPNATRGFIL